MAAKPFQLLVLGVLAGAAVTMLSLRSWTISSPPSVSAQSLQPIYAELPTTQPMLMPVANNVLPPMAMPEPVVDVIAPPVAPAGRREAFATLPTGTFIKEMNVAPYGNGRIVLNYAEDQVTMSITGTVLGFQFELTTESEITLSRHGVVYGVITDFRLGSVKPAMIGEGMDELQLYSQMLGAAEPLINEMTIDMPFSYHIRVQEDRITISQFRVMLAGPNPLGKLGGIMGGADGFAPLSYFQAINLALEGTYHLDKGDRKPLNAPERKFAPKVQPKNLNRS